MEGSDLDAAIAALVALKDEHRPLMMRIAADTGMEPETRVALVAHVLAEEDEKVAALAAGARVAEPAAKPGLTVGSLRAPDLHGGSRRLGSLRHQ